MLICREMRSSSCGSVWSTAFSVTEPLMPGWMSMFSLASRASANSRSCAATLLTTTLYVSGGMVGAGLGSTGAICTGGGIAPAAGGGGASMPRCVADGFAGACAHPATSKASTVADTPNFQVIMARFSPSPRSIARLRLKKSG